MSTSLKLEIDASAGRRGSREYIAAINAVKKAVNGLERDTVGAFKALKSPVKVAVDTGGAKSSVSTLDDAAKKMALAVSSASRVAQSQLDRLTEKSLRLGDSSGLAKMTAEYERLQTRLSKAATPLDVRAAKSQFADAASSTMSLNRSLEQQERIQNQAKTAAASHAASLESLKQKYNPLYAASRQYESALDEINRAESQGAITAQLATDARQRAAAALSGTTSAVDANTSAMRRNASTTQQGVMVGHQLSDVLITSQMGFQSVGMIALQQGSQLAAQMNMLKASGGGVFKTLLSGVSSLINPLSLITIGAVAAGAMIAKWFFAAGEETKKFKDALGDANTAISNLQRASDTLSGGNIRQLRREYGALNSTLDDHLARLKQVAAIEAASANSDMVASMREALTSDGNLFTNDIDAIRRAFDTTNDRARIFMSMMQDVENAKTFQAQADAVTRLRQAVESTTGGLGKAEGGARGVLAQLIKVEDAALRLLAAQNGTTSATNNSSNAASTLTFSIGTAADEAARLLANLNGVPGALSLMGKSVQGQIAGIQAQNKALNLQLATGLSGAAANRRVQLDTMVNTAGARGQKLNLDQIGAEYAAINKLDAAAKKQAELRKKLNEQNRPAKKGALSDTQKATEKLTTSIKDRLTSLQAEKLTMDLLTQGTYKHSEAATLAAQVMMQNGGSIDATTAAMLRQIEAQALLNEEAERNKPVDLRKVTADSLKDGLKAGLSAAMQGDTKNFAKNLASSVQSVLADAMSEKIVASLGIDQLFNIGSASAATQMQTGIITGGQIAANSMAAAISTGKASAVPTAGGGGILSWFGSLFGFDEGVANTSKAGAWQKLPQYAEGTANTSGGIPAILHDNEAVIPLSRGRKVPVELSNTNTAPSGGMVRDIITTTNVTVEGDASEDTASEMAEIISASVQQQVDRQIQEAMSYGGFANPRGN
jgi:hypothetical protein